MSGPVLACPVTIQGGSQPKPQIQSIQQSIERLFVETAGLCPTPHGAQPSPLGLCLPSAFACSFSSCLLSFFFFFFNFYLFMIVTERERGRDTGRGRSRLPAGNPMRAHEPRVPLPPPQPPPRIQPREEGSRPTTEPPRRPSLFSFLLSVNLPAFRLHLRLFLHLGFVLENRLCPWLPPSQPSERGGVGWASVLVLVRACGLGISGVRLPGLLSPSSS